MDFFKKELFSVNGFHVTVLMVLVALVIMFFVVKR